MRFTRHRRDELQFVRMFAEVFTLRESGNQRLIGQLPRLAHAVHQNDSLEFFPDFEVLQNRQKRRHPGACG
ncbi:hypothetical protein D3C77_624200 [compost metagenome]